VNPYGVAIVPTTAAALVANNVLVSNFNNAANLQGTGTTIVQISPSGGLTLFAKIDAASLPGACPGGVGLTTALVALRSGFVIVGSLPTTDGASATAQAGCLIILNSSGQPVATLSGHGINGPWDMTAVDMGTAAVLFVTNVLGQVLKPAGRAGPDPAHDSAASIAERLASASISAGSAPDLRVHIQNGQSRFANASTESGHSRALRTQLPAGRIEARKQFRIRLAQRTQSALELTLDLGEIAVDQLFVFEVVGDGAIYLCSRDRRKRLDDLFGSSPFIEVSDNRIEPDTSACDPKSAIFLIDIGRYWKRHPTLPVSVSRPLEAHSDDVN
jgi:hypothetical protein